MRFGRVLFCLVLLSLPFGSSADGWFRRRPVAPPTAILTLSEAPDAAWALALEHVWKEGRVRTGDPTRPAWTPDEAVAAAFALQDGRDRRDAFAAWVVGEAAWAAAVRRAGDRLARSGDELWPGAELPPDLRRVVSVGWRAAVDHAERLTIAWPVAERTRVSSRFGPRRHPILGLAHTHAGVDLSVPVGTAVYAAQDGVVSSTGAGPASGRFVVLDHGEGVTTRYYHLDAALVARGDRLARGAVVGRSGRTGRVTGPHLHFEVRLHGRVLDPELLRALRPPAPGV